MHLLLAIVNQGIFHAHTTPQRDPVALLAWDGVLPAWDGALLAWTETCSAYRDKRTQSVLNRRLHCMGKNLEHCSPQCELSEPNWAGKRVHKRTYTNGSTIFAQGDPCTGVLYVSAGLVRLSVVSKAGKQAIFAVVTVGDFFGEGCLAGQRHRTATATAMADCTITTIPALEMRLQLESDSIFADRVFADMLDRHIRLEEALIDQLFNSTERRLARTLLLLARFAHAESLPRRIPRVSQELLAEMVGSTRTRVNFFMNKFRRLGHIEYDHDGMSIKGSLLNVVLPE